MSKTIIEAEVEKNTSKINEELRRIKLANIVFRDTPYLGQFRIEGNKITKINNGTWYQLFFSEDIPKTRVYRFSIKILHTQSRYIMIGVVKRNQSQNQISCNTGHAICYVGYNGNKYPANQSEGEGFSVGEAVQVTVNRSTNTVQWAVGGAIRATVVNSMLAIDNHFLPYVEMCHANDIIEWQGSEYE